MDVVEKKEVVHEYDRYEHEPYCRKEYASKGVAGAGLGLGVAGTALGLLALSGRGLFGLGGGSNAASFEAGMIAGGNCSPTSFQSWQRACDGEFASQKALYEYAILDTNARFADREKFTSEMFGLYKNQTDSDFGLYKNQRDQYDVLAERIGKLETAAAVGAAVEPWRSKVLQMQINNVAGMVQLEAERRCCADNKIVNYTNSTFYPINVANVTVGTTSVTRTTSNPLCGCCDGERSHVATI